MDGGVFSCLLLEWFGFGRLFLLFFSYLLLSMSLFSAGRVGYPRYIKGWQSVRIQECEAVRKARTAIIGMVQ